jgi:hypothetical protein
VVLRLRLVLFVVLHHVFELCVGLVLFLLLGRGALGAAAAEEDDLLGADKKSKASSLPGTSRRCAARYWAQGGT